MTKRARTDEQINDRKKEIIKSLDELYLTKDFKDIYLKDVASNTSITRTAIYSYYSSIEEILLDSFFYHLVSFDDCLECLLSKEYKTKEELIEDLSSLLVEHKTFLKIMSLDLNEIEKSSSFEMLVAVKQEFMRLRKLLFELLKKNYQKEDSKIWEVISCYSVLVHGLYVVANPTEKQKEAMDKVGMNKPSDLKEMIRNCFTILFSYLD